MTQRHPSRRADDPTRDVVHAFARVNSAALRSLYRTGGADHAIRLVVARSAIAILTAADSAEFNRVVGLGVFEPATEKQLDQLLEPYRQAQVPFMVQLLPAARPPELREWLSKRGLDPGDEWSVLTRDLSDPVEDAPGPEVTRVADEDVATYARTYESAFGLDFRGGDLAASTIGRAGWSHYLAREDGRAIAVAAMFERDGAALFAGSGTVRTARGRGAQRALVRRRLADAARAGSVVAMVETDQDVRADTPPPLRNILHAGFVPAFREPSFVSARRSRQRLDPASGRWV